MGQLSTGLRAQHRAPEGWGGARTGNPHFDAKASGCGFSQGGPGPSTQPLWLLPQEAFVIDDVREISRFPGITSDPESQGLS